VALPLQGLLQVQMSVTKARKRLTEQISFQLLWLLAATQRR